MTHRSPGSAPLLGLALGLLGVIIFSGTLPATKVAVGLFDPAFLTFARATLAAIASWAFLRLSRRPLLAGPKALLMIIGVLLVYGFPGFMGLAMQTVPSAHGAVVLGILPLATAAFAVLLAKERVSGLFWLCSIVGAALVIAFALRGGARTPVIGDLWLTLGGLSAALGYVLSGRLANRMPGWEIICRALILTAPITFVGTALTWDAGYLNANWQHVGALSYLGLGSMFLGFFAWNAGMHLGGIARVGQLQLFQVFFTIAISALALGEAVSWDMVGYAVGVFAAVALGQSARRKRA
ncbi:MAG: DMT family transporter [Pseudomonadota bacterium]